MTPDMWISMYTYYQELGTEIYLQVKNSSAGSTFSHIQWSPIMEFLETIIFSVQFEILQIELPVLLYSMLLRFFFFFITLHLRRKVRGDHF